MFGIPEEHIDNLVMVCDDAVEYPALSVIEECGELITELSKFEADRLDYDVSVYHIFEEMTHVLISMNLLARQIDYNSDRLREQVIIKATKARWDASKYTWS